MPHALGFAASLLWVRMPSSVQATPVSPSSTLLPVTVFIHNMFWNLLPTQGFSHGVSFLACDSRVPPSPCSDRTDLDPQFCVSRTNNCFPLPRLHIGPFFLDPLSPASSSTARWGRPLAHVHLGYLDLEEERGEDFWPPESTLQFFHPGMEENSQNCHSPPQVVGKNFAEFVFWIICHVGEGMGPPQGQTAEVALSVGSAQDGTQSRFYTVGG